MKLTRRPEAKSQMLIRKPVEMVFTSLIDPAITSRFWFSKSSGRVEAGSRLRWDWEMYDVFTNVDVKSVKVNERILIEWNGPDNPSLVEWTFDPRGRDRTFVRVRNWGFGSDAEADAVVEEAINSTEGFTFLLASMKAFLEHDLELNLVPDHAPDGLVA